MAKLKKNEYVKLHIKSPYSNLSKDGIIAVVHKQWELLPMYRPEKWTEPVSQHFDITSFEKIWPKEILNGLSCWKKTGKNRATGSWSPRKGSDATKANHASLDLSVHNTLHQQELLNALKELGIFLETDYAFLDAYAHQYRPTGWDNEMVRWGLFYPTTYTLRHWLPDMTWATVFGPAYVKLFGKEKLLSTPAHHVEDLGQECVFIQLTPSLGDLFEKFDEVMEAREVAKQHLGYECFFQASLAYNWEAEGYKAGKVFRTPEFHMHNDYVRPKTFIENPETGELFELIPGAPLPSWFFDESSRPVVSYDNASWHYGAEFSSNFYRQNREPYTSACSLPGASITDGSQKKTQRQLKRSRHGK